MVLIVYVLHSTQKVEEVRHFMLFAKEEIVKRLSKKNRPQKQPSTTEKDKADIVTASLHRAFFLFKNVSLQILRFQNTCICMFGPIWTFSTEKRILMNSADLEIELTDKTGATQSLRVEEVCWVELVKLKET